MTEAKPQAPEAKRLRHENFKAHQFAFNEWSAVLEPNHTIEDALSPEYWASHADTVMGHNKADPKGFLDLIKVRKPSTAEYWELLIVGIGRGFIKTKIVKELRAAEIESPSGALAIRWNVGRKRHEVVRADGAVMQSGFQTKEDAADWIKTHNTAMAA